MQQWVVFSWGSTLPLVKTGNMVTVGVLVAAMAVTASPLLDVQRFGTTAEGLAVASGITTPMWIELEKHCSAGLCALATG